MDVLFELVCFSLSNIVWSNIYSEIDFSIQDHVHAIFSLSKLIDNFSFFEEFVANPFAHIVQIPALNVLFCEEF